MRVEVINGRKLVCEHIYPANELVVGQEWAPADGGKLAVTIRAIEGEEILYGRYGEDTTYSKDWFNFQCRYCLVLKD
jgi:hypothetical protein